MSKETHASLADCNAQLRRMIGEEPKEGRLLSGQNVPDPSHGRVGDMYFAVQQRSFYGPKTEDGWGDAMPIGYISSAILEGGSIQHGALPLVGAADHSSGAMGAEPNTTPPSESMDEADPTDGGNAAPEGTGAVKANGAGADAPAPLEPSNEPPPAAPGTVEPPETAGDTADPAPPAGGAKPKGKAK